MCKERYVLIILIITLISFLFCDDIFQTKDEEIIIINIDMEEMVKLHLPNFNLIRQRAKGDLGTEYVFFNINDSANIFIRVGLHKTANNAENFVLDYLDEISMGMNNSPILEEPIGDTFWWFAPNADPIVVTNIIFTRKNAHFEIISHDGVELIALAKAIDDDILTGASYITYK
jgi:hypothetical protein